MIITTEKIPNKEIIEILGVVRGSTFRARNICHYIFAGLKNLLAVKLKSILSFKHNQESKHCKE